MHIAHVRSQTDAVQTRPVGRITEPSQLVAAKVSDDGRFGESLKASVGATTPITTPRVAKRADEGDRAREEAPARRSTPAQEGSISSKEEYRKAEAPTQEEPAGTKTVAAKKTGPKDDASGHADTDPAKPAAVQTITQPPVQANSIAPAQQAIAQVTIVQPYLASDSPVAPDTTNQAGQSAVAGSVTSKSVKEECKRADETASGPAVPIRSPTVTETMTQSQAIPQPTAQAEQGAGLAGSPTAAPHHIHTDTASSVAPPGRSSEVATATLSASADGPQASDSKTLVATPNVLEVGIASGSHGWLRVRAELDRTGEVAASVLTGSQGVADGLHRELPAISAYLAGERVDVNSLVVHAADNGASAQDAATSSGAEAQSGSGQSRQESSAGRSAKSSSSVASALDEVDFSQSGLNVPATIFANGTGSWLSVRV